jgi:hypothetical protein
MGIQNVRRGGRRNRGHGRVWSACIDAYPMPWSCSGGWLENDILVGCLHRMWPLRLPCSFPASGQGRLSSVAVIRNYCRHTHTFHKWLTPCCYILDLQGV